MQFLQSLFPADLTKSDLLGMVSLFAAYVATALIGTALFRSPAVIFPAAAVALAGLLIGGIRLWPAVFFASITAHAIHSVPALWILGLALGHTVQAITAASLLHYAKFDPVFRRLRDMFAYMLVAGLASTIVPSIGIATLYLNHFLLDGPLTNSVSWGTWWLGVFVSILLFGAVIVRWLAKIRFTRTPLEWLEIAAGLGTVSVLSYLMYWTAASQATSGLLLLVYLVPFVWFSLRLGMRFTLLAFAITSIMALTGVFFGHAPSEIPIGRRIITLEVFLAALAGVFYLFVSMVEERQRAARLLNQQLGRVHHLLEDAKRTDRAKSEFIAVFAHELRNPLAPIVSATELLKIRWGAHPEIAPLIETLENRTSTIVHLLDDLLDLARISQGKLRLRKEMAALCDITRRSALSIESQFKSKDQTLTIETPSVPIRMEVDPVRIEQIVNNLLSNASKFSPHGSRIELCVQRAPPAPAGSTRAEIRVTDHGVGIKPEMILRIFEPFLQVETEVRNSGLGIGLSLTKKLVEEHGGAIIVKSDGERKGSEFVVSLPFSEEALIMSPIQPMELLIQKTSMKILVVDDNEAAANGLGTLLKHVGNTVEFAYVGADVAYKAQEFKPDVIVLDIGLPDISGYEVAQQLRKNGFGGKIIALTGYGQDEDKKKAEAAGFDHHLTKPVGLADLQAVLLGTQAA